MDEKVSCSLCPHSLPQFPIVWCRDCEDFNHDFCHAASFPEAGQNHRLISEREFFYDKEHLEKALEWKTRIQEETTVVYRMKRTVADSASAGFTGSSTLSRSLVIGFSGGVATTSLAVGIELVKTTFLSMSASNAAMSVVVLAGGLAYNAVLVYRGRISWADFGRNMATLAGQTTCSLAGFFAGAGIGSLLGPIGAIVGGIIGGIAGAAAGHFAVKKLVDKYCPGSEELAKREILKKAMEAFSVDKDVTLPQIEKIWKRFARVYHPDMNTGDHEKFCMLGVHREILIEYVCERDNFPDGSVPRVKATLEIEDSA